MTKKKRILQKLALLENQLTRVEEQVFHVDEKLPFLTKELAAFQQAELENEKAGASSSLFNRLFKLITELEMDFNSLRLRVASLEKEIASLRATVICLKAPKQEEE